MKHPDKDFSNSLDQLDDVAYAVYLEVPQSQVVSLQAHFELYEGIGIVRTLDLRTSLLCILTTASELNNCYDALVSIQPLVHWRFAGKPSKEARERYLGYFSNASNIS